jgi:hypothetical protein
METVTRSRWWLECVLAFIGTSIVFLASLLFSFHVSMKGFLELVPVEHSLRERIIIYSPIGVFFVLCAAAVAEIRYRSAHGWGYGVGAVLAIIVFFLLYQMS